MCEKYPENQFETDISKFDRLIILTLEKKAPTLVCACHTAHLFVVTNLSTNQEGEDSHVETFVVLGEYFLVVSWSAVRHQHNCLVAVRPTTTRVRL